jgi:hypothetical protein
VTLTTRVFILAAILTTAIVIGVGIFNQFYVRLNDFWGLVYFAENLQWKEKASLYNGLFPIGYPLLLRLLPYDSIAYFAFLANSFFAALAIAALSSIVATSGNYLGTAVAFVTALTYPALRYAGLQGPDIGCIAFICIAVWLLWKDSLQGRTQLSMGTALLVGGLLGLAPLWRTHGIVISAAVIFSYLLVEGIRSSRIRAGLIIPFLSLYSIQIFVNLISGHGAFENATKANIYANLRPDSKFSYFTFPTSIQDSVLSMVLADPFQTATFYESNLSRLAILAWPAVFCLLVAQNSHIRRYSLFALTTIVLYAFPVAMGGSPRAPLVLMPMFVVPLGFLFAEGAERLKRLPPITQSEWLRRVFLLIPIGSAALLALLQLSSWLRVDVQEILEDRRMQQHFTEVQRILLESGMKSPKEVFTDSFDLFFPDVPPYRPRANGGWFRYALYGYNQEQPNLPIQSAAEFIEACGQQGIRFLVITPSSKGLADFLVRLYNQHEEFGLGETTLIANVGPFKIFVLP